MIDEKVVPAALALIAPPRERADECREEIMEALALVELEHTGMLAISEGNSHHAKRALGLAVGRLRNARDALRALPGYMLLDLSMTPNGDFMCRLDEVIDDLSAREVEAAPSGEQIESYKKRHAVRLARGLLLNYGRRIALTSGSDWCRLSAMIFTGDDKVDPDLLRNVCRAYAKQRAAG